MTQEALKLALEALQFAYNHCDSDWVQDEKINPAITAIKEALAQQEPWCMKMNGCKTKCEDCPVEVAQPEQEPVADDFFRMIADRNPKPFLPPQRTEQEPVAWRTFDGEGGYDYCSYEDNENYADDWNKRNPNHKGWVDKLYTKEKNSA